jgi:EAL domain-containing protein (putative c-di-GMP-specific phosphodiesterase class I)
MQRVLLVLDDEELVGAFIRRAAEGLGFRAQAVTTPAAFQAALAQQPPDEIVLDLQLGASDGIQVLRLLAAAGCQARITLLSGFDPRVLASAHELALELGLNIGEALTKPVRLQALREALAARAERPSAISRERLAAAIADRELFLEFQPIVACATGAPVGVEALARWVGRDVGRVPPDRFIPVAEADPALMDGLTLEVARQAAGAARAMRASGYKLPVAINISAQNLRRLDFPERLSNVIERAGASPPCFKLEVTETAAMTEPLVTLDVLLRFRLKGFNLAVDDFGAGHTSVAMLRRLPYAELKIDRSYVSDLPESSDSRATVQAIVALARGMELATVAEGVESAAAFEALHALGVTAAQGYHIGRPAGLDRLLPWLHERTETLRVRGQAIGRQG